MDRRLKRKKLGSEDALRKSRRAAADKEISLTLEARAKTLESYASTARKVVPMVALAYGLSVSFSYFFLAINFFPSGLSLGDTLLYVFIALGYGLLAVFFICGGLLVVLPVLAFDEGSRHRGMRLGMHQGRGIWVFPPLVSPLLLALFGHVFFKAYESEVNKHASAFIIAFLAISIAIGVASHRRAWRLGAGESADLFGGIDSWLPLGLANGFVFQGLYSFVIMEYGATAVIPIMVSSFAGMLAWVAMDMSSNDESGASSNSEVLRRAVFKNELGWGKYLVLASIGLSIPAAVIWFVWEQQVAYVFCIAVIAFLCWFLAIVSAPLFVLRREELMGPLQERGQERPLSRRFRDRKERRLKALILLVALAFSTPLVADLVYMDQKISTTVFKGLGLREGNTTVRLKGEALSSLKVQARNSGIELSICTESDGSATVSPVNVLWHGLGQRSLLSFGQADNSNAKDSRGIPQVEVASEEMKVLRNQGSQCRDVSRLIYFGSGKASPAVPQQEQEVIKEVKFALSNIYPSSQQNGSGWVLDDIIVTGFADPMQLGEAGNEFLARQRAACLASKLFEAIKPKGMGEMANFNLRWDGEGARSPVKTSCPLTGDQGALAECHAANRVAKVRLIFSCQGADGKHSEKCKLAPVASKASSVEVKPDDSTHTAKPDHESKPGSDGRAEASANEAGRLCSEAVGAR